MWGLWGNKVPEVAQLLQELTLEHCPEPARTNILLSLQLPSYTIHSQGSSMITPTSRSPAPFWILGGIGLYLPLGLESMSGVTPRPNGYWAITAFPETHVVVDGGSDRPCRSR